MHELSMARGLRRFRLLNRVKQTHLAELLGVSQGTLSRWENGTHVPDPAHQRRIEGFIAAHADHHSDAAIKRLVTHSTLQIHLVCDATHRLLAASCARSHVWRVGVSDYLGLSLWKFASPEIMAAEATLLDRGWYEGPSQRFAFETGHNHSPDMPVFPSVMEWETIPLADGRMGRLATTIR